MIRFLLLGMDTIAMAVILLPILLVLYRTVLKEMTGKRKVLLMIFGLYLCSVFSVTGLPTVRDFKLDFSVHMIPLIDIIQGGPAYWENAALNILLFLPFGFLLPFIWERFKSWKTVLAAGFCLSLFIETAQIFTYRLTDIDDLLLNSLGAVLGYAAAMFWMKNISPNTGGRKEKQKRWELPATIMLVSTVMFFASPYVVEIWWTLLLG